MLHNIKNKIKSNDYTRVIYDKLQCALVKTQYKLIKKYYQNKPIIQLVDKKEKDFLQYKKPNLFYFGGDELQDKSGFLQALEKYTNLTYFTKENGKYGSYNYGVLNRKKNIKKNRERLMKLLSDMDEKPDILLMQTWEWRIGLQTLTAIRKVYPNIKIVNIAMDDRHSFWLYGFKKFGSAGLIDELDFVFTTSSEAVEWYLKEGINAYFYPLASNEKIFYPIENIEKIYDVGFVGAKYGIREKIINKLRKEGINVKAYGNGWEDGRLPIEQTNIFYNQCKIVLGVNSILGCKDFSSMKLRDFDVPMSGSVYLTSFNEDTAKIFIPDVEAVYYNSIDECISKVKFLLSNEDIMKNIRDKAYKKALNNTYDIRVKFLLNTIIGG